MRSHRSGVKGEAAFRHSLRIALSSFSLLLASLQYCTVAKVAKFFNFQVPLLSLSRSLSLSLSCL